MSIENFKSWDKIFKDVCAAIECPVCEINFFIKPEHFERDDFECPECRSTISVDFTTKLIKEGPGCSECCCISCGKDCGSMFNCEECCDFIYETAPDTVSCSLCGASVKTTRDDWKFGTVECNCGAINYLVPVSGPDNKGCCPACWEPVSITRAEYKKDSLAVCKACGESIRFYITAKPKYRKRSKKEIPAILNISDYAKTGSNENDEIPEYDPSALFAAGLTPETAVEEMMRAKDIITREMCKYGEELEDDPNNVEYMNLCFKTDDKIRDFADRLRKKLLKEKYSSTADGVIFFVKDPIPGMMVATMSTEGRSSGEGVDLMLDSIVDLNPLTERDVCPPTVSSMQAVLEYDLCRKLVSYLRNRGEKIFICSPPYKYSSGCSLTITDSRLIVLPGYNPRQCDRLTYQYLFTYELGYILAYIASKCLHETPDSFKRILTPADRELAEESDSGEINLFADYFSIACVFGTKYECLVPIARRYNKQQKQRMKAYFEQLLAE